jgi:hypothetical protein
MVGLAGVTTGAGADPLGTQFPSTSRWVAKLGSTTDTDPLVETDGADESTVENTQTPLITSDDIMTPHG